MNIVYCKDCKYSMCWRSGELAQKYGKAMECSINVLRCPDDFDYCSKGVRQLRCPKCNKRYDFYPNFCWNCGEDLRKIGSERSGEE